MKIPWWIILLWATPMAAYAADRPPPNYVELPALPPAMPTPRMPPQPPKPPNADDLRPSVCVRPAFRPVMDAYHAAPDKSQLQDMVMMLRYGSDGMIVDARIEQSSGDDHLDAVAVAWARRVKICPVMGPGEGRLPIEFQPNG